MPGVCWIRVCTEGVYLYVPFLGQYASKSAKIVDRNKRKEAVRKYYISAEKFLQKREKR
jgi:hypothetical protein